MTCVRTSDSAQPVVPIAWRSGGRAASPKWSRIFPRIMSLRCAKAVVSLPASRSAFAEAALILALLAVPSTALAQRDPFFSAVVTFYRSLAGLYGDEGPQLTTQLAAMSTALDRWNNEI